MRSALSILFTSKPKIVNCLISDGRLHKWRKIMAENDFKQYLKSKIKNEILSWDKDDIYAVYIGVSHNNRCDEPLGLPFIIEIGFGCGQKRDWHLACSSEYEKDLIETANEAEALVKWLEDSGVENIGVEDKDSMYDDMMIYIGKGPSGLYETVQTLVEIVREFFEENFIAEKFGEEIPVIFDDLETTWYCVEATENANPQGLAEEYLRRFRMNRKNSGGALFFAKAAMLVGSVIVIATFFPCALCAAVITLIAGGIRIPLTAGGIVKVLIAAAVLLKRISTYVRLTKMYDSVYTEESGQKTKQAMRTVFLTLLDTALAAAAFFSCMVMPDRLIAGLYMICVLIYIVRDRCLMKAAGKNLMQTRGDEISRAFGQMRNLNGSFAEDVSEQDSDNVQ